MELIMLVLSSQKQQNIAKQYGIKVYTIGIGTNGMAEFHMQSLQMVSFYSR
jgi:hypothetical protein